MFRLQQNPDVPCLLEQSFDGGETWSLAFDYSLCRTSDTITIQNTWNTAFTWNIDNDIIYDNDIINIYPVWQYTGGSSDADNDAALCAAIHAWVDMICEATIATIVNENADIASQVEFWSTLTAAMGTAAVITAAFGIYPATGLFAGTGLLLSAIAVIAAGEWQLEDADPYRNETARDEVVCAFYGALAGKTPTYSDWSTALADALTGDAEDIREIVHAYNQAEMGFVNWMGFFADMIAIGATSLGNECAACATFSHIWEIDELSGSDPHTTYNNDAPTWTPIAGTYVPSVGIDGEDNISAGKCRHMAKADMLWSGSRKLTSVRFDYDWAEGDIDDWGAIAAAVVCNGVAVQTWNYAEVQGIRSQAWTGSRLGVDEVRVWIASSYENENGCGFGGTAVLERVVIQGVGECPFD